MYNLRCISARILENYEIKEQSGGTMMSENRYELNKNLAQMLKGGVIMDVTTPEQARMNTASSCAIVCNIRRSVCAILLREL